MATNYYLDWYPENGKFWLRGWQDNELGNRAFDMFWPSVRFDDVQNSALMQAYQTNETVRMDVTNQELNLQKDYKSLNNTHVVATPGRDMYGNRFIRCVYTCLSEDKG